MNKSQEFLNFLGVRESKSALDQAVAAMDKVSASKLPRGYESVVDLLAQVLNGGLEQWVSNDYTDEYNDVMMFLKDIGPIGKECASQLQKMKSVIDDFAELMDTDYGEDDYQELADKLDAFDKWMYASDRSNKIAAEMVKYLKDHKII